MATPIAESERTHYNQAELVEFLASANGYSGYLIDNGYFNEAICFNLCMVDITNNLAKIKKVAFRISLYYLNAAVAAFNMGDTKAKAYIQFAKADIAKNGAGTIHKEKFEDICKKIEAMPDNNGIPYIS